MSSFYWWQKLFSIEWAKDKEKNSNVEIKKFAFLIHPRDSSDVARKISLFRFLPEKLIELIIKEWGFSVCSHFIVKNRAKGYLLGVGLTARQMLTLSPEIVRKKILEAVLFAQERLNAEVVGLGALTTSVTEGGEWLVNHSQIKLAITHGDTYGVAVAQEGIEKILNICKFFPQNAKIAIVGAYGLIGRELVKFLARKGYPLILIEKNKEKTNLIKRKMEEMNLSDKIFLASENLKDILPADLVITTTSHPSILLKSEHLKKGAVIYDIAQPMNVSPELIKERPDIIKIDGAYVDINGIDLGFNLGPPKGTTYACLVETMMMTLEGDRNHHVGEINEEYLEKTKEWAKKYGFSHAPFTSFGKPIVLEEELKKKIIS